jgi:myxalamid-type polyketide synthase MxaE and MxaD
MIKEKKLKEEYEILIKIREWLIVKLSEILNLSPKEIDITKDFSAYNLNKQESKEFVEKLGNWLGRQLTLSLIEKFKNIEVLAWHLAMSEPVAIIGMSCRVPGADNIREYWDLLKEGRDTITDASCRWDMNEWYDPDRSKPGKIVSRWGGFIDNLEMFDASFFNISPREAYQMDPRQRLILELSYEAFENAGIVSGTLKGSQTGVYIATLTEDYYSLVFADPRHIDGYSSTGVTDSIPPNRVSYCFDFHGPSITVDTACSGSLVSVEMACQSIRRGECDIALAGGVQLNLIPDTTIFFSKAGALSETGRCKTFDAEADGIARGEGAGVILLKPLYKAIKDGDHIYAVIRGASINSDGKTDGIIQPNQQAQEAMLRQAYNDADVDPCQVQYIEAHGTGTKVGDPIEVNALIHVLGQGRSREVPCALGSVKTNFGHLEAAAGIVGLIKTLLAIEKRLIPPTVHFKKPNPAIPFDRVPFFVQEELGHWPSESLPLIAGISSFGFGGTNAHLVIEEAYENYPYLKHDGSRANNLPEKTKQPLKNLPYILPISARSKKSLHQTTELFLEVLQEKEPGIPPGDICYTMANRRNHFEHRLIVMGNSKQELAQHLQELIQKKPCDSVTEGEVPATGFPGVVFVYSGQGSHWQGMAQVLVKKEPVFREALQQCARLLRKYVDWSLLEEITAPNSRLNDTDIAQPAVFAIQVALTKLWSSWGIVPAAIVGHSLGEICAAYTAGVLSLEEAIKVVVHRSRLMKTVEGKGKTAVVELPLQDVTDLLQGDRLVSAAGSNSPTSCVISGDTHRLTELQDYFQKKDVFFRMVRGVEIAFHSHQMEPLKTQLKKSLQALKPNTAVIPLFSTVTGDMIEGTQLDADYWARNLRDPFLFSTAFENLLSRGHRLFLEISPHPLLGIPMKQCLGYFTQEGEVLFSMHREKDELRTLTFSLGRLYVKGYPLDWQRIYPTGTRCYSLPHYSWDRARYWFDQIDAKEKVTEPPLFKKSFNQENFSVKEGGHPLLGQHFCSALEKNHHFWIKAMRAGTPFYLTDHKVFDQVVLPAAAYIEMALAAARQLFGGEEYILEDTVFKKFLFLSEERTQILQVAVCLITDTTASWSIYSAPGEKEPHEVNWELHSEGKIRVVKTEPKAAGNLRLYFKQIQERCPRIISPSEHYTKMNEQGLNYGPLFQGVQKVQLGEREAIGWIQLPQAIQGDLMNYKLHPVNLDAALQVFLHYMKVIPVGIKKMHVYDIRTPNSVVLGQVTSLDAETQTIDGDIQIIDESGELVLEVSGLLARGVEVGIEQEKSNFKNWLYDMQWLPMGGNEETRSASTQNREKINWIIFSDTQGLGEQMRQLARERGENCVMVYQSDTPGLTEQEMDYYISPSEESQYEQLFSGIFTDKSQKYERLIFLWGLEFKGYEQGCAALICVIKALLRTTGGDFPRLWVITRGAQYLPSHDNQLSDTSLAQSPLWGLARTVNNEHPELWGGVVDLENKKSPGEVALLTDHIGTNPEEKEILIRNCQKYNLRLSRWESTSRKNIGIPLPIQKNGAYLIPGGLGGLGLMVARRLIMNGARHLILLGRSKFPPRTQWLQIVEKKQDRARTISAILEMEAMGALIRIESIDVTDASQMEAFVSRYRQEMQPEIRGVIHLAGIQRDQLLMEFDTATLNQVMGPKVLGAWNLHQVFKNQTLDFFILFSSVVSLIGIAGLADYAAANAFMDTLAHYRRSLGLPATSINWGSWGEVGMAVSYKDIHAKLGVFAMNPGAALDSLEYIIRNNPTQVAVADIDWKKWHEYVRGNSHLYVNFLQEQNQEESVTQEVSFLEKLIMIDDILQQRQFTQNRLQELAGKVMKIDPAQIDPQRPLTAYGMDSIMAFDFRNVVAKKLGVQLSLVELLKGFSAADLAQRIIEQIFKNMLENENIEEILTEVEKVNI